MLWGRQGSPASAYASLRSTTAGPPPLVRSVYPRPRRNAIALPARAPERQCTTRGALFSCWRRPNAPTGMVWLTLSYGADSEPSTTSKTGAVDLLVSSDESAARTSTTRAPRRSAERRRSGLATGSAAARSATAGSAGRFVGSLRAPEAPPKEARIVPRAPPASAEAKTTTRRSSFFLMRSAESSTPRTAPPMAPATRAGCGGMIR
mmetsp:Transcript_25869/g.60490  ORF Transcript_25869/g.60490 Transcript_25869/m.60490 type:complete len:206 (+) Transcript_25869:1239-1856(+)